MFGQQSNSQLPRWPQCLLQIVEWQKKISAINKRITLCSHSWCGKKQTLMITSKDGGEGNGAASSASTSRTQEREQEMVTLMNKEKVQENGNTEEFTVITLEESPDKEQQAWARSVWSRGGRGERERGIVSEYWMGGGAGGCFGGQQWGHPEEVCVCVFVKWGLMCVCTRSGPVCLVSVGPVLSNKHVQRYVLSC